MSANTPLSNTSNASLWNPNRGASKAIEWAVKIVFGAFAFVSVITTVGIVLTLIFETFSFFQEVSLWRFLTERQWTPLFAESVRQFGIFVLISATFLTSGIAISVAVPLGLLAAVCLSEYASTRVRSILKPALEILAGVPTVVYGYFAVYFFTPFLRSFLPVDIFNALSAGVVMGIAITPLVASLSEDAIYAVPRSLRDGAYALGATKRETILSVVLPGALSGIVASIVLAVSRAIGETMIVTMAAGQTPNLTLNPFESVMTMTASIVQVATGDAPFGTIAYKTLYSVGMTLFLMTLALNFFSFWFVRRFQQKYE